jgi:putative sigma-54 modulation protein
VEKVGQQAHRLSDRWKTRRRPRGQTRAAALVIEPVDAAPGRPGDSGRPAPRGVRTRPRAVKPMSLDDALLTLSGAAQNFLVFRNADSDGVAILYRRPDGDFGLIEPEG